MLTYISLIILSSAILISLTNGSNDSIDETMNSQKLTECFINNQKYLFDYLYSNKIDQTLNSRNVFTCSLNELDKMNDFNSILWNFIPVIDQHNENNKSSNEYYIKPTRSNNNDNFYLCATNKFENVLQPRYKYHKSLQRLVQTTEIKNKNKLKQMNECHWTLDKVKENTFIIRNQLRNETLYAGSQLYKLSKTKRNVYLWPNQIQSLNQNEFKWIVICSKDIFDSNKTNKFLSFDSDIESLDV